MISPKPMSPASPANDFYYNPVLKEKARYLRNNGTKSEACLWKYVLKSSKLKGYKFLRQRPVLNYIADFMCKELMLIIENDGYTHLLEGAAEKDLKRQQDLEEIGFTVIRFKDEEVLYDIENVKARLERFVEGVEGLASR